MRQGAAVFLGQVLGLSETATDLANDLSPIKRDVNASIYTIQLESSVGPAAFLVYAYVLDDRGGEGHTGKELFDAGLATLQQAAERSSPGPRAVAHAETDAYAFILATTPGTYRALTGAPEPSASVDAIPAHLAATEDARSARSEAAQDLLDTLRAANAQATNWLTALQLSTEAEADDDRSGEEMIVFSEEETELALFLLDDESIGNLLRALNLLVSTAQRQAAAALNDAPDSRDSRT
jgi:hypothetical protein